MYSGLEVGLMGAAHSETAGAVRFPVPVGWTVRQQVILQLPASVASDGIDFHPNIVMMIHPLAAGVTIDAIAEERWQMLKHHLSQFERGLALWGELFGERAIRMTYRWQQGTHALRQALVLCALEGSLYEITFSDVTARFDRSVAAFDQWLSTLVTATARRKPVTVGQDIETLWGGSTK
jgi:hypothetical protein